MTPHTQLDMTGQKLLLLLLLFVIIVVVIVAAASGIVAKQKVKLLYGQAKCMCTTCTLTHKAPCACLYVFVVGGVCVIFC